MHAPQQPIVLRRTIRFWLNCLVIACVVPAVIIATFIIYRSFNQERVGLMRDTVGTARALSQAVDAELKGARSAMLVLSRSPQLVSGDLRSFYDDALHTGAGPQHRQHRPQRRARAAAHQYPAALR